MCMYFPLSMYVCGHACALACAFVCVSVSIQLMHSSRMESVLWRRPCCLHYWVCQDCEGKQGREERKWVRLAFRGLGMMPHAYTKVKHPHKDFQLAPEGNFLPWFIQESLHNSGTVVCLWHMHRCAPPDEDLQSWPLRTSLGDFFLIPVL